MTKNFRIWILIAIAIVTSCDTLFSAPPFKSFTLYNASSKKVLISNLTGIYAFGKRDPRSKHEDNPVWPGQVQGENTWGTMEIEYPITLDWAYSNSPERKYKNLFNRVEGFCGNKISKAGSLILAFGADLQWHLVWIPDNDHLTENELDGMFGRGSGSAR